MESSLRERIAKLKEMAGDSLRAADILLREGLFAKSLSQSYYAMFYMVDALIQLQGESAKSHSGLSILFSKLFIKTGLIDKNSKDVYVRAMEERMIVDYETLSTLSKEKAVDRLVEARGFVNMVEEYLEKQGYYEAK